MQPQQTPQQMQQQPINAPIYSHPPAPQKPQKKQKGKIVAIILLSLMFIAAAAGAAYLGYLLYKENQAHQETKQMLVEKEAFINDNAQVLRDADLEPSFRKILQDNANRNCSSNSAIIFNTTTSPEKNSDESVKKYYAVGQYVCNIGDQVLAYPVRFVAAQSYDGITWEFTYGSSTSDAVTLPKYIFNTDPALYNRKYNNPKSV